MPSQLPVTSALPEAGQLIDSCFLFVYLFMCLPVCVFVQAAVSADLLIMWGQVLLPEQQFGCAGSPSCLPGQQRYEAVAASCPHGPLCRQAA